MFVFVFRRRLNANAETRDFDMEESMGLDNLAYRQPRSLPDDELENIDLVTPQTISRSHINPEGQCQTLDDGNVRAHIFNPHLFEELIFIFFSFDLSLLREQKPNYKY